MDELLEGNYLLEEDDISELLQLVGFTLNEEEFAIDIIKVQEIIRIVEITNVPKSPPFVEGVINLRGEVIPIIDLRKRFHIKVLPFTKESRIIVVDINNSIVGLIVDRVSEVIRLPVSAIKPTSSISEHVDSEYIKGVGKLDDRLLSLIEADKILSEEERSDLNS